MRLYPLLQQLCLPQVLYWPSWGWHSLLPGYSHVFTMYQSVAIYNYQFVGNNQVLFYGLAFKMNEWISFCAGLVHLWLEGKPIVSGRPSMRVTPSLILYLYHNLMAWPRKLWRMQNINPDPNPNLNPYPYPNPYLNHNLYLTLTLTIVLTVSTSMESELGCSKCSTQKSTDDTNNSWTLW